MRRRRKQQQPPERKRIHRQLQNISKVLMLLDRVKERGTRERNCSEEKNGWRRGGGGG